MTKLEEIARSMWAKYDGDLTEIPSPQPYERYADNWLDLARAAVEAMPLALPGEWYAVDPGGWRVEQSALRQVIIDHILNEKP
jgi:hypothetical protein